MRSAAFLIALALVAVPALGMSDSISNYNAVSERIALVDNVTAQYQSLVLNLNSQGALISKPIEMLNEVEGLASQSKSFLSEGDINDANSTIEEAVAMLPQITLDISSSYTVNRGRLALEESLSIITSARSQGYDTKGMEDVYYNASSILNDARQSYTNGDYGSVEPKVDAVISMASNISTSFEELKAEATGQEVSQVSVVPTGFFLLGYSWVSYPIILIIASSFIILKATRRKKELKGIEKLVRIKCRLE